VKIKNNCTRLALVLAVWHFCTCPVFGAGLKQLKGHVPEIVAKLAPIGSLPPTNELHLAIGVPLRDPVALDQFLADIYNPASPNFRHFLTTEEFAARFGATDSDYAAVKQFALTNGLKITGEYVSRLLLDVTGKAADVERAFHIKLNKFKHPTENREFFAPDAEPSVGPTVPILHISGLNNYSLPHPHFIKTPIEKIASVAPRSGSGSGGTYLANDLRAAYVPGTSLTGAGQNVGLLQFDGYYASDITKYISQCGITTSTVLTNVLIDGGPGLTPGSGNVEVALDIEMVLAMAPGVSKIYVYEGTNGFTQWATILGRMANDNVAKQLSSSWGGGGPDPNSEQIFKQMVTQGQSFFNASGDQDSFNGNNNFPGFPSDSTNVIQVGGTTLTTSGPLGSYVSETAWNDRTSNPNGGYWGSSGGIGPNYSIPSYQQGINMTNIGGSNTKRNVPDVALTAKNIYSISDNGSGGSTGGTSCAAPLWAGFMALVNQQLVINSGNPTNSVGFINPAVYTIGKGLNPNFSYASSFHDITTGDNTWPSLSSQFYATNGYDLCTGWGTPNGQNLINALAAAPDALAVTPFSGFTASGVSGGPFSPSSQNFTLTNTGASSLSWTIINTSAWLNVSSSSGTLAAGASSATTVSLGSSANSLSAGAYSATVLFSNQTTQVAQPRSFSLQVSDSLALLTTNGFTTVGPVGGPFKPGAQSVTFTNLGANPVSWSLINTSSWLTVSSSSGTIPGNNSVSVTVATNAAAASLGSGVFNATLVLSNQSSHAAQSLVCAALVGQSLVQNGGFETGDLTAWTLSDSGGPDSVDNGSSIVPHTGNYAFAFGQPNSLASLTQNLATTPGQTYLLSFWCSNPKSGTGTQIFQASWNGNIVFSTNRSSSFIFPWTNLKFVVTATSTSTPIQFAAENNPDYFGLDDVSVTPVALPAITQQPTNLIVVAGNTAVFSTAASGTSPLAFQWRSNGVNLANGSGVSGATTNVLTLTGVTTNRAATYTLVVTNLYGSVTSSPAILTVVAPPAITTNLATQTIECGGNASFTVGASGTAPLSYQWSLDGAAIAGATNVSYSLANVHLPGHTVAVVVTNLYGRVTNSAPLNVQDTTPPLITLNGANPFYVELGGTYADPGATAYDLCAGVVPVSSNGVVNTSAVSTNTITYTAGDGNGNTGSATRTVIVRDTTPPAILWSFTNLVLAAGTNTSVLMPDVTGTNYILATDLSGTVNITQNPAFKSTIPLGTNTVVLTVADLSGNAVYSTNSIIVVASTNSMPKISNLVVQSGGGVTLQLSGGYGSTYILESTTDFTSGVWSPVATNTIGISGVWQFTDTGATSVPARFYRLELVQ
jgi:hypothetical protein